MSDDVVVWLVRREYTDKGLITLEYATPDGSRSFVKQISPESPDPTAAKTLDATELAPVEDPDEQARFASEAERMQERHDPDDTV